MQIFWDQLLAPEAAESVLPGGKVKCQSWVVDFFGTIDGDSQEEDGQIWSTIHLEVLLRNAHAALQNSNSLGNEDYMGKDMLVTYV